VAAVVAASVETVAAAVTRTARVFLLRLPSGQPRLRGTDGVVAKLLSLLRLPNGRPPLQPPDPPDPPALSDPPSSRSTCRRHGGSRGKREEKGRLGGEDDSAAEWASLLERSGALKEREHKKPSQFNEPRRIVQRMTFRWDTLLTHAAWRFSQGNHYGRHKSLYDRRQRDITLQRSSQW
jgi:hypothetical protein